MNQTDPFILNDGAILPKLGFGTYRLTGSEGADVIAGALDRGYRLLDTAFNYGNEGAVGEAIRRSGVPRDQIVVSSKLPGRHHAYREAVSAIEESVYRTGLDHLDLYLIHWPNPKQGLYAEAWRALIEARARGLVRSIGVCNFLTAHLDRLIAETSVIPSVNQIELHPYFPQDRQRADNRERGIVTQAWSPLGRAGTMMQDTTLAAIAHRLGRTIPQVILRWHVELGVQPLPKATSPQRQIENRSLFDFELGADDMATIATLARPDGRTNDQDPAVYEEF